MTRPDAIGDALVLEPVARCGLVLAASEGDAARRQARRAETLGFDSLWVGDHIAFHVPIPDSLTLLSFAAGATDRIALGTAVYLAALRHPVLTAKSTATLDRLASGRLVLGVGLGGEFPPEWQAVGVPLAERAARVEETVPLLRRLWTQDAVAHTGTHFRFDAVTLAPKPLRTPPIWFGGRAEGAMRRMGRLGDGYISHMCAPDRYRENLRTIAEAARTAGRGPIDFATAAFLFTVFDTDYEAAHARASALLGRVYARDFRDAAKRYCLLGRPEDCLDRMREFARSGARHFILVPLSDPDEFAEHAAATLLPALAQLGAEDVDA